MEKHPLTIQVTQVTPGEAYRVDFTGLNSVQAVVLQTLKVSGVVGTPHSIVINFSDASTRSLRCRDLATDSRYISIGTQTGTEWFEMVGDGIIIQFNPDHTTAMDNVRFHVTDGDTGDNLTFTRLTMKFEITTVGGNEGSRIATSRTVPKNIGLFQ
jgi:hypothetical protein